MATGKTPFHNVTNLYALMYQLASEKKSPDIPSELSDSGKDFLAKWVGKRTKATYYWSASFQMLRSDCTRSIGERFIIASFSQVRRADARRVEGNPVDDTWGTQWAKHESCMDVMRDTAIVLTTDRSLFRKLPDYTRESSNRKYPSCTSKYTDYLWHV